MRAVQKDKAKKNKTTQKPTRQTHIVAKTKLN